jgi:hypothetical protein
MGNCTAYFSLVSKCTNASIERIFIFGKAIVFKMAKCASPVTIKFALPAIAQSVYFLSSRSELIKRRL